MADEVFSLVLTEIDVSTPASSRGTLYDSREWKIFIPSVNRTILISDYSYNTFDCNSCGSSRGERITSLNTCSVNGTMQQANAVRVNK